MKSSVTLFSNSDEEVRNNILTIAQRFSITTQKNSLKITKNSDIFNIYFEKKIPSWKATEIVPEILVISANPPSLCVFLYPQEWQTSSNGFSWDQYSETTSWEINDSQFICPSTSTLPPFWEALTYDRSGGIISETVVIGTIFDDQE